MRETSYNNKYLNMDSAPKSKVEAALAKCDN